MRTRKVFGRDAINTANKTRSTKFGPVEFESSNVAGNLVVSQLVPVVVTLVAALLTTAPIEKAHRSKYSTEVPRDKRGDYYTIYIYG